MGGGSRGRIGVVYTTFVFEPRRLRDLELELWMEGREWIIRMAFKGHWMKRPAGLGWFLQLPSSTVLEPCFILPTKESVLQSRSRDLTFCVNFIRYFVYDEVL